MSKADDVGQLGLLRQAESLIVPPKASTPHGTCESAMNAASEESRPSNNEPRSRSQLFLFDRAVQT